MPLLPFGSAPPNAANILAVSGVMRTYINDSLTVIPANYVCLKVNYLDTTIDPIGVITVTGIIVET